MKLVDMNLADLRVGQPIYGVSTYHGVSVVEKRVVGISLIGNRTTVSLNSPDQDYYAASKIEIRQGDEASERWTTDKSEAMTSARALVLKNLESLCTEKVAS